MSCNPLHARCSEPPKPSPMKRIFVSEQGLRSGWSLAVFCLLYSFLTLGTQYCFATIPVLRDWSAAQPRGRITAIGQIDFTGLELLILLISVFAVAKIERRPFRYFGTGGLWNGGLPRILGGAAFGFAVASALVVSMALLGGFSISGLALDRAAILPNSLLFGVGFVLVGLFEEFAFRGYLQATLQRGIGVWPAATVLSLAFGAIHLPSLHGNWTAAAVAACFGWVAVFALRRTGNLWFIIGTHSAIDWTIAFFYSAPITGQRLDGHLFQANLIGPDWLTGGAAGPVGSLLMFPVLALAALAIHLFFPRATPNPP